MSINWATVRTACYTYATSTGRAAIWADQSAPKPARPYVAIKLSPLTAPAFYEQRQGTNLGEFIHAAQKEFSLSVEVVASTINEGQSVHLEEADKLVDKLHAELMRRSFAASGIAIIETSAITDLTEYLDSSFEPRAVFDVRFRIASNTSETLTAQQGQAIQSTAVTNQVLNESLIIEAP